VTELPIWGIWLAALLVPAAGVVGGIVGSLLTRKGAKEADNRGRREELMRQLRWASELTVSEDPRKAQLGVDQLIALASSALLSEDDKIFIDATLASAIHGPQAEIEAAEHDGQDIRVVQLDLEAIEAPPLPFEEDDEATAAEDDNGEEDVRGA
jgi:hypothetical protein